MRQSAWFVACVCFPVLRFLRLTAPTRTPGCSNSLTDMAAVSNLHSLLSANLQQNQITAVSGIGELRYLQIVNVNNNAVTSLAGVASASLLQLSINSNELEALDGVGGLSALRRLEATGTLSGRAAAISH